MTMLLGGDTLASSRRYARRNVYPPRGEGSERERKEHKRTICSPQNGTSRCAEWRGNVALFSPNDEHVYSEEKKPRSKSSFVERKFGYYLVSPATLLVLLFLDSFQQLLVIDEN